MPKAFSEPEREHIRERLLNQGYRLFSSYGLKKTNVEELTSAVGISKGAFYSFYDSKEALFMDVIEEAEVRLRQEILAAIDLPGPSPRARLFVVLQKAFAVFESIPLLQFVTSSDYSLIFRKIPPKKLKDHLSSDRAFFDELIARCRQAGIPIQAQPEQIASLLYPLALTIMHESDFGWTTFGGNIEINLELVAAFCLGEIELQCQG
jgi:AcrR family transcriptional regulator